MARASAMTESSTERRSSMRRWALAGRVPCSPEPNSRSNTRRGLFSGVIGVVGDCQEMLYW